MLQLVFDIHVLLIYLFVNLLWKYMILTIISNWCITKPNKAIRDGRPRPPGHQVGWDIVRRECACQISWWSVEKWRRYYILKFHGNTFRWPTTLTFDLKFWKYLSVTEYKNTDKHTNKQTWALQYLALPLWGAR